MTKRKLQREKDQRAQEGLDRALDPAATLEELRGFLDQEHTLDAALQNPVLPLAVLEDVDFWAQLSADTHGRIVQSPHCPTSFVQWVLRQEEPVHYLLLRATQIRFHPRELRRQVFLRRLRKWFSGASLRGDPYIEEVLTAEELRLFEAGFARSPLSLPELEQLARLGRLGAGLAAEHPDSQEALLEWLLQDGPPEESIEAIRHPHVRRAWLEQALLSPDPELRALAAKSPVLTPAEVDALACDAELAVRLLAARHPALPQARMASLACDPDWQIRAALAGNPAITAVLFRKLRHDEQLLVRMSVVERADADALLALTEPPQP